MRSFLSSLRSVWSRWFQGKQGLPALPDFAYRAADDHLMDFLQSSFAAHGASALRRDNWIWVDEGKVWARAAYFNVRQTGQTTQMQVDFVFVVDDRRHLVESFAGIGDDFKGALEDACQGFLDSTFHALFHALLGRECSHCDVETWSIGGRSRKITMGMLRTRGHFPGENWTPIFEEIQKRVEASDISPGLHWMRIFYGYVPKHESITEVLLDNEPVDALQKELASLPWPKPEGFYFVRLFFLIQDAP